MALICSEEKPDIAAHVAAPILLQRGDIVLLARLGASNDCHYILSKWSFLNWQLISIAKKEGPTHDEVGWRWST